MPDPAPNAPVWGPDNPHPLSRLKTELVWEGKYDEYGNRRPVSLPTPALPLQRIETIDEPRDRAYAQGALFDMQKAHYDDSRNVLVWGDNKLTMISLLEEYRKKVNLVYIDPPFDVGADFTMQVQIGNDGSAVQKEQAILEEVAYRDTWGKSTDSYLHMMYERLLLIRELLADDGSLYVHCDWRVDSLLRLVLDDVFARENFRNRIVWQKIRSSKAQSSRFGNVCDTIFFYSKGSAPTFNALRVPHSDAYLASHYRHLEPETGRRYRLDNFTQAGQGPAREFGERGQLEPPKGKHWIWTQERINEGLVKGLIVFSSQGMPSVKRYLDDVEGNFVEDLWTDIEPLNSVANERTGYDTQKPEALIDRVVKASTKNGDLVADFFCGSGTTLAVAEKLGRRWIGVDLGRYAVHTTRKRLIQVQRELHKAGKPYRSFDVYNLGRYERQWWQMERLRGADAEHRATVLKFYKAAALANPPSPLLHGRAGGAFVHVDQIDGIFTLEELRAAALAAQAAGGRELHCLAWEFEMGLSLQKASVEHETGLTIRLKYIPREIMEPNRTEVQFFEAGYLEAKAVRHGKEVEVQLLRFNPSLAEAPEKEMAALRERAVKSPFDFIDFWAVDFEHRDGKPFEHHWQDFRTRKDRRLKTTTDAAWTYDTKGRHEICVKVIDVFGVDTTAVISVET